jgi:hypothetical protein
MLSSTKIVTQINNDNLHDEVNTAVKGSLWLLLVSSVA